MPSISYKKTSGLALLEAIVGIFIVVVVFVMTTGFWPITAAYLAKVRTKAIGAYVAEQVMENALALGYEGVDNLNEEESYAINSTFDGQPFNSIITYYASVKEVSADSSLLPLKSVQVKIVWDQEGGEVVYETYIAKNL